MHDDVLALFAYDRWANWKMLDARRKLTVEQKYEPDETLFVDLSGASIPTADVRATGRTLSDYLPDQPPDEGTACTPDIRPIQTAEQAAGEVLTAKQALTGPAPPRR